jgi:hypothetical protein
MTATHVVTTYGTHRLFAQEWLWWRRGIVNGSVVTEAGPEHAALPLCAHCCDTDAVAAFVAPVSDKYADGFVKANLKHCKPLGCTDAIFGTHWSWPMNRARSRTTTGRAGN